MKEIVISPKVIRRELWIMLGCFLFAVLFDLFAIIKYGRPFAELFRTVGYVLTTAVVIYLALALLRLLVFVICRLFRR